jgi:hypothetical protein
MKLTEKEEKIARLALDKGAQIGERQAAAAKLIESLYQRGVSVEDIENESVRVEYRDRVQTQTVYPDRPTAPARRSKPQFSVVPQVLRFKTPTARENARLRCVAMLEEEKHLEAERIALSDQGQFRSAASIEIHWRVIKLNERLIITAMRAGQQKLAELCRQDLKRLQNDLLRATGWPVEEPEPAPAPQPARVPEAPKWHDKEPPVNVKRKTYHIWARILGAAAGIALFAMTAHPQKPDTERLNAAPTEQQASQ